MAIRIYLDANVVIRAVESDDDEIAARVADLVTGDAASCVTSELTLMEVLVGVLRPAGVDGAPDPWLAASYKQLFRDDGPLTVVPVGRNVLLKAAGLRAANLALKLPDAIHLASAMLAKCEAIVSGDRKFCRSVSREDMIACSLDVAELDSLFSRIASPL